VLLDIGLPDMDGFEVARVLLALDPAPGVVLISSRDAATYGDRVPASPAAGFVRKDDVSLAALAELVAVVRGPGGTE
jgi:DNA-binding NarL/FixJ family response regulator